MEMKQQTKTKMNEPWNCINCLDMALWLSPLKHTPLLFQLLLLLFLLLWQPWMVLQSCEDNETTIKVLIMQRIEQGKQSDKQKTK